MNKPFEYIESLEPIPVEEHPEFKILNVANMIPIFVEYEYHGKKRMVAYIDYETQNIVVEDINQNPDFDLKGFKDKILDFLKYRSVGYRFDVPIAPQDKVQEAILKPIEVPTRVKDAMEEIINAREDEPSGSD